MSITIERYITPWNIEYERGLTNDMLAKTLRDHTAYCYKLRELVRDMLRNIHGCTFHHSCGSCDFDECIYETRAHELGIEMDE